MDQSVLNGIHSAGTSMSPIVRLVSSRAEALQAAESSSSAGDSFVSAALGCDVDSLPRTVIMDRPTTPSSPHRRGAFAFGGYRLYVLALLWLVMLLRFLDIQVIAVLLESIKKEFAVSDTKLGLLTGFAFSVLYGALGVPVAWLADRANRRDLVAIAVALWSAMTAACALATSFVGLFWARIGVGVGEAGGQAPAYSLISDYFPAERRASIFAILSSAVPVGVFCGFIIGGFVNAHFGWRAAFAVVGLPGLLVAILVRVSIREPSRQLSHSSAAGLRAQAPVGAVRTLLSNRSYRQLVLGSSLFTLGAMGSGVWIPSFFIRVHHLPPTQVAVWLACMYGCCGTLGAVMGGALTDRWVARTRDPRWYAWVSAGASAAIVPLAVFVYLWPHPIAALLVHALTVLLMHVWMGPVYGTVQTLAGPQRRAIAAAVNMLAVNLIAYGMGPLLVGLLSDELATAFGARSLGYAILTIVVLAYTSAATHFFFAGRTLTQHLGSTDADHSVASTLQAR